MRVSRSFRAFVTALAGVAVLGSGALAPAGAAVTATTSQPVTAQGLLTFPAYLGELAEQRKVDRVPTPQPAWSECAVWGDGNQCTTVDLPLDYDEPWGATTSVAVLRHSAADQANKLGTLFVNPGGPGGSGVVMAAGAHYFLSPEVVERFDIVGFDPRGINFSSNVRCWENMDTQAADLSGLWVGPFPSGTAETKAYVSSAEALGKACATRGTPLAGSMSTAQVARDMDVLRRMVGDEKLTYLGFSYGSHLGNVYANLFPSRVRAVAIDGVIDPVAWAGTPFTRYTPSTTRLKSGEAAAKAFDELLDRCTQAGPEYCNLSSIGDPHAVYAEIRASLQANPVPINHPETGELIMMLTYPHLVGFMLGDLYSPYAGEYVDSDLSSMYALIHSQPAAVNAAVPSADVARAAILDRLQSLEAQQVATQASPEQAAAFGADDPYYNDYEAFNAVLCTDGDNPALASSWPAHAAAADRRAPDFGTLWTWSSAACASSTWTVKDEDAFKGPFNRRTANPVLVVGSLWDPSTSYQGAVTAASLLPNSRLLSSDNWGHTAYGTSACVTDAMDRYLLTSRTPAWGAKCVGDVQPFTTPLNQFPGMGARAQAVELERQLPPVVPLLPGVLPRG
jgi:pimeloyl-ACP methyl ester carboxylesterase